MASSLRLFVSLLTSLVALTANAQVSIRSAGVLGNSGEAGAGLVRFTGRGGPVLVNQHGLGLDREGFLWAFAGPLAVNRYSQDGRLVAVHPLPKAMQGRGQQMIAVAGDRVIILSNEKLWSLSISAAGGTAPEALALRAQAMSLTPVDGRLALIGLKGELTVWDAASGKTESRGVLPGEVDGKGVRGMAVILLPDGALLIDDSLKLTTDGQIEKTSLPGRGFQWLGGYVYAYTWHMTIQRVTPDGTPAPGVVFGGKSGAFIGKLHEDGEVYLPSGIVHLGGDRYAVTSGVGVIHLLQWDEARRAFAATRRIGAIHRASGLGIDRQGRVWWNTGYWEWHDGPADLPRNTTFMADEDGWQLAFLASDAMTGLSRRNNRPFLYHGPVDYERNRLDRPASNQTLLGNLTGAAVFGETGKEEVVMVAADGRGVILLVDEIGRFRSQRGPISLKFSYARPVVTSLANSPEGDLLAADGNAVVRLKREGDSFTEVSRTESWGNSTGERFGNDIHIAAYGTRLWVSDPENQRVLLFTLSQGSGFRAPAIFTGDDEIGPLDRPRRIAARGDRAVVVDWENQRLVKLELTYTARN